VGLTTSTGAAFPHVRLKRGSRRRRHRTKWSCRSRQPTAQSLRGHCDREPCHRKVVQDRTDRLKHTALGELAAGFISDRTRAVRRRQTPGQEAGWLSQHEGPPEGRESQREGRRCARGGPCAGGHRVQVSAATSPAGHRKRFNNRASGRLAAVVSSRPSMLNQAPPFTPTFLPRSQLVHAARGRGPRRFRCSSCRWTRWRASCAACR
jgi:hypothetical protein